MKIKWRRYPSTLSQINKILISTEPQRRISFKTHWWHFLSLLKKICTHSGSVSAPMIPNGSTKYTDSDCDKFLGHYRRARYITKTRHKPARLWFVELPCYLIIERDYIDTLLRVAPAATAAARPRSYRFNFTSNTSKHYIDEYFIAGR
jgi:hypothetical protein